mgnify:CR=1 FL=1
MNELTELLGQIPAGTVIMWLAAITGIIGFLAAGGIKGLKLFEKARKARNATESKDHLIRQNRADITEIKQDLNTLYTTVSATNEKINDLSAMLSEMQVRNDAKERANLKDRIGQAYHKYHQTSVWNSMEKEALEDLIESYEQCGGTNSFIHSVVQKEMYTWEVIE